MSKLKDSLQNPLEVGLFVSVELGQPINLVKGRIETLERGHVSTLAAPGKDPKATPTRIVIMVPVEIFLDPRAEIAGNISALKIPLPTISAELPRRCHMELMTPAELAIHEAIEKVENAGVDVRLTDAVVLLSQAKVRVADFVDGVPKAEG